MGYFLKGNLVVVTFKNNTEEIVESLKGANKMKKNFIVTSEQGIR